MSKCQSASLQLSFNTSASRVCVCWCVCVLSNSQILFVHFRCYWFVLERRGNSWSGHVLRLWLLQFQNVISNNVVFQFYDRLWHQLFHTNESFMTEVEFYFLCLHFTLIFQVKTFQQSLPKTRAATNDTANQRAAVIEKSNNTYHCSLHFTLVALCLTSSELQFSPVVLMTQGVIRADNESAWIHWGTQIYSLTPICDLHQHNGTLL